MTLAHHASQAPGRLAIASPHGNRTFAELNANANRVARVFRANGLQPGDQVSLLCANRPQFAEVFDAALRTGLRITPVNWHLTGPEIAYILENSESKALVADARFAEAAAEAVGAVDGPVAAFSVAGEIPGFDDLDEALAAEDGSDLDDPVLGKSMLYTSGTTGRPKGVVRETAAAAARRELKAAKSGDAPKGPDPSSLWVLALIRASSQNGATDRHLCTGPLYHAAPLAFSLNGPLAAGCGVILMDRWEPEETLRLIEEHHITHSHMVPTMFHRLLALPDEVKKAYDLSSLRFVLHGAAPCPVAVKADLIEWLGPVVYEYYAATEGGGTFVSPQEWLERPGTVGMPLHPDLVRILGPDGDELPRGEVGAVYMRAPDSGKFRYFKDDDKTSGAYLDNYFTLGDHGYVDDDGWLFLTGRSAELIISGGVNIYPAEVDAVLLQHPAVSDAGVIGVANDEWGEEVKAVVELKPELTAGPELAAEILEWCRANLAHYKCPRTVDFVDELPRHDNGKLYRAKLRDLYAPT
jgi:long-chain acyl-CoA synthetase